MNIKKKYITVFILLILSIGMVCCFITGVSEYLAYLQNPLGATLNYLITGR
jgi:hypothetical protein